MFLQYRGQGENIAYIVVYYQYPFAGQGGIVAAQELQNLPLRFGKIRLIPMQEQHRLFQRALERIRVPHHALPRQPPDIGLHLGTGVRRAANDHGQGMGTDFAA